MVMASRRGTLGAVAFAALVVVALAGRGCAQPDAWAGVDRIVAVGDVHGDYEQFVKVLRAAEVVDRENRWIAGKTHLVQLGDILGRGPRCRDVMDLVMRLETQAAEAGGAVHVLVGNHEHMVLTDDWRYVHPDDLKAFGGAEKYRKAMSAEGRYGRWIRGLDTVIKINDLVFVHAGITPSLARLSLAEINKTVRDELLRGEKEGIAESSSGPLWNRALALDDEAEVAKQLAVVLKACGANRMVIAHTVSRDGVMAAAGGRLIRVDVGMAECYGGPAACLVIEKGAFYEVRHPKARRKLQLESPAGAGATTGLCSVGN